MERDENNRRINMYLKGAATFIRLLQLASILEQIPPRTELHLHLEQLAYIDHSCLDLLSTWEKQQQQRGSTLVIQWDGLLERYRKPICQKLSQEKISCAAEYLNESNI